MTAVRRPDGACAFERQRRVHALVEHRLEDLVAGVSVAVPDGDRLIDLVAPAMLLARGRADATEDTGERDRPLEDARALAPVRLGVRLQEARDIDVARALVLARRQAVRVVIREDQLEVGPAKTSQLLGLGLDLHPVVARARAGDRRVLLALDLDHAHAARAEPGQLRLVAEGRDLDPVVAADLEDRLALDALDDATIDLDPDARRRLRPLRGLRVEQALGKALGRRGRAVVRPAFGASVGTRDEVSHGPVLRSSLRRRRSGGTRRPGRCCSAGVRRVRSGSIASRSRAKAS